MQIKSLVIRNFRALAEVSLEDLASMVVIAGPNGCGKSCIFDAIRLLKSVYGGYQPNEWQHWIGEFQINSHQQGTDWRVLCQDKTKPLEIRAEFGLSVEERDYLDKNVRTLLQYQAWKELVPEHDGQRLDPTSSLAANLREQQPKIAARVEELMQPIAMELQKHSHIGQFTISPEGNVVVATSRVLELVFGNFDPANIGIIDHHSANRNYNREQVAGNIDLNIASSEQRMRQHALYNHASKYHNLKSEMAATYVRGLLATRAGAAGAQEESLVSALKELFTTFFPGKEFLGPIPTQEGGFRFPVRLSNGTEHDIDELSAGEKEVLYGYLRLRNRALKNSVILIDEPELHLNPRLISGLAPFYQKHLGRTHGNQIWLVTHSDTLIRESVGQEGFNVYHLQPAETSIGTNQACPVNVSRDLDRLIVELIGDLAAYKPGAKIVVFEGGGTSEFDVHMTSTLFPEFRAAINPISGGNKRRVNDLYELLDSAKTSGYFAAKFYSITDLDGQPTPENQVRTNYRWDAYHIENYLLEPKYILKALLELRIANPATESISSLTLHLKECARSTVHKLISHQVRNEANSQLFDCMVLGVDSNRADIGQAVGEAVSRAMAKLAKTALQALSPEKLTDTQNTLNQKAESDLLSDEWKKTFRGRDVLRDFVGKYVKIVNYEVFRDLVMARMRDEDFRPAGMNRVVQAILADRL